MARALFLSSMLTSAVLAAAVPMAYASSDASQGQAASTRPQDLQQRNIERRAVDATLASAQVAVDKPVLVTADNFPRAESDLYFGAGVKRGGFGKIVHDRAPPSIDKQTIVRMNRDTLYSGVVVDLSAGPATITLPDSGKRYMALQVVSEDEYTPQVIYSPGPHTFTQEQVGTRYAIFIVRTLMDPENPKDREEVHKLQDALKLSQPGGPGKFEVPHWDPVSQKKVRDALLALASTLPDTRESFGPKGQVDPVHHLIGAASALRSCASTF